MNRYEYFPLICYLLKLFKGTAVLFGDHSPATYKLIISKSENVSTVTTIQRLYAHRRRKTLYVLYLTLSI